MPLDIAAGVHSIMEGMGEFLRTHFAPFKGTLRFGHLESPIRLYPPPSAAGDNSVPPLVTTLSPSSSSYRRSVLEDAARVLRLCLSSAC